MNYSISIILPILNEINSLKKTLSILKHPEVFVCYLSLHPITLKVHLDNPSSLQY